jgi:cation-transporting ATPase E
MATSEKAIRQTGLTTAEVEERVAAGKVNGVQTIKTKSVWQILRSNIFTFFNFVFIALAIILSVFVEFDASGLGNFGFMVLVVFNCLIGIIQELRAKRTIDKLSLISAPRVIVIRDGEKKEIAVEQIVLDDVMVLSSGGQICADAVVSSGFIEVNESLITGEPDAILKHPGDKIMSGSFVVAGKAQAIVEHVGIDNFVMKISAGAKYFKKPNSQIWRSLMLVIKVMAIVIIPVGIALFLVKYLHQDGDLSQTVINTVATIIGMIPSGLVALTSAVFAVSVMRLARHKTLAQDLYCVETLARVDVLCLDKTGTITEGSMELNGISPAKDRTEEQIKQMLKNLMSALDDENATANAIRCYVDNFTADAKAEQVVPFSSDRKWSGAYIDGRSYIMGAPEFIFKNPSKLIQSTTSEMAEKGFRVLVLASAPTRFVGNKLPAKLRLESFVFITDKIRAEAPDTLKFFKEQGVTVKIISGDNPETVRAVAKRAGVDNSDDVVDMSKVTTDKDLRCAAENYTIFGRVLPEQKLKLIKALKSNGHTVAMTGDGVNDVLALKEADCSIAMASGSDAAKNVSSLVLLNSNFASLPRVVAEGRRSINNLEKTASLYLVKTIYNFLLALIFMIISAPLPFEPKHLTLIGSATIGVPSVILALEPNSKRNTGRFLPKVLSAAFPGSLTVVMGVVAVLICNHFFLTDLSPIQSQSLYLIITTFVSFMYLIKVCMPMTLLRAALIFAMMGYFVACYFIPYDFVQEYFGLSKDITWEMGKAILAISGVLIPLFALMLMATKKAGLAFEKHFDAKQQLKSVKAREGLDGCYAKSDEAYYEKSRKALSDFTDDPYTRSERKLNRTFRERFTKAKTDSEQDALPRRKKIRPAKMQAIVNAADKRRKPDAKHDEVFNDDTPI